MGMLRVVLIIIDGIGDEYIPELDGTPLEYASGRLHTLNRMAKEGICGIMHPVAPGVPPSSDIGHLSIFGYDIEKEYPGRGYFEALGAGLSLSKNEIAFRVNLATVREENGYLIVTDRRAGRISGEDAAALYQALNKALHEEGIPARVVHTIEHRGVLVLRGDDLLGAVTDTDPHETGTPILAAEPWRELSEDYFEKARKTAEIINEITMVSYKILSVMDINASRMARGLPPANVILIRGGGMAKDIVSFMERWGFKPAFIAAGALYKGIARALGMEEIHVTGATGTPDTNLDGKVDGCLRALDRGYDFVFLHIKGTDNLSHDKKPREKAKFLIRIDQALERLYGLEDSVIIVTGDHSTSSLRGRHIGLPVPLLIWSGKMRRDRVEVFNETACSSGGLGTFMGRDLMRIIMDMSDRSVETGTRPEGRPLQFHTER